ncbi:MAG: peptidase [Dehalococcoidia bacterium]|nr:peptidase [Dehalococcoidia bacterium]
MTFCLGINLASGLIGIADTRVVTGTERITSRKLWTSPDPQQPFFLMSSGLRSVRDKVVTYFEESLATQPEPIDRVFKAVNLYAQQVRRVADEDRAALVASGFRFDSQTLIGGQLSADPVHRLFLVYPEGNWVEVGQGTPYQIIGETGYGKPILDRTLKFEDSMRFAFKVGCLAFDSTRISAADVDFPIDVVLYVKNSGKLVEHRYAREDLEQLSRWWQERLRSSIDALPAEWIEQAFSKLGAPVSPSK